MFSLQSTPTGMIPKSVGSISHLYLGKRPLKKVWKGETPSEIKEKKALAVRFKAGQSDFFTTCGDGY